VPEDIKIPLDHGTGVDPGVQPESALVAHHLHEVECGIHAGGRVAEPEHRAITKELHEPAAVQPRGGIGMALERAHRDDCGLIPALAREASETG
jgi:hypothetical protein